MKVTLQFHFTGADARDWYALFDHGADHYPCWPGRDPGEHTDAIGCRFRSHPAR